MEDLYVQYPCYLRIISRGKPSLTLIGNLHAKEAVNAITCDNSQRDVQMDRETDGCKTRDRRSCPRSLERICLMFQGSMSAPYPVGGLSNAIVKPFLRHVAPETTRSNLTLREILRRTLSAANGSAIHNYPTRSVPRIMCISASVNIVGERKGLSLHMRSAPGAYHLHPVDHTSDFSSVDISNSAFHDD